MHKHLFIGVDGGASCCRARIRDMQGNLLGEGYGGPANIHFDLDLAGNPFGRQAKRPLDQPAWTSEVSTAHTPDWA